MKLYYTPGACSLVPHIVLEEAGLGYDLERVDLRAHQTEKGEDYYGINPKGYVPALRLDDGSLLTELGVIAQYVADRAPEKKLAPEAGTMERYRLQEWLNFIATEIHKSYGPMFNPAATEETKKNQLATIGRRLAYVAKNLEGKSFLLGEQFTVADAYLFVLLTWSRGLGPDIGQWPALSAFFDRVKSRPAVKATLVAEGLEKA